MTSPCGFDTPISGRALNYLTKVAPVVSNEKQRSHGIVTNAYEIVCMYNLVWLEILLTSMYVWTGLWKFNWKMVEVSFPFPVSSTATDNAISV